MESVHPERRKGCEKVDKLRRPLMVRKTFIGLIGVISLLMGTAEYYTMKIGWFPRSEDWKGPQVHLLNDTDVLHILPFAVLTFVGLLLFVRVMNCFSDEEEAAPLPNPLTGPPFALTVFFLLMAWMPFFAVFFPGTGMNDTTDILRDVFWASGQHTFLYCLYLGGLGQISEFLTGTMTAGLVAASLIQMLLMAMALAAVVTWLYRRTDSAGWAALLALYYGLTPIIVNYSFANVKDTFFSVIMLLWIPLLYEMIENGDQEWVWTHWKREFIFLSIGLLMLRNNGPYVYLVLLVCLSAVLARIRWRILGTGILLLLISMIPNAALNVFMDLPQLFQEKVGIPIQQVARVADSGVPLTNGETQYINRIMKPGKMPLVYDPFTADGVKWNYNFNEPYFNTHPDEFMKNWRLIGKQYPKIYAEAWLLASYGYWSFPAPDGEIQSRFGWALDVNDMQNGMRPEENNAYRTSTMFHIFRPDTTEKLGRYLFNHSRYLGAGTCFWLMTALSLVLISRRKYRLLLIFMPAFLCWGTLMAATPSAFVYRYVFFFPLCMPIFFLLPFLPGGRKNE